MEYGVFSSTPVNWNIFWVAFALAALGILFIIIGVGSKNSYKEKVAIFGNRVSGKGNFSPEVAYGFSAVSFSAAVVAALYFLFSLLFASGDIHGGGDAGPGGYKVLDAFLIYEMQQALSSKGYSLRDEDDEPLYRFEKPDHFELKFEGRADPSHPSTMRVARVVDIPFERMAENYKYLLKESPTKPVRWEARRIAITVPGFALKYQNGWWQFTDMEPK